MTSSTARNLLTTYGRFAASPPLRNKISQLVQECLGLLFPHFSTGQPAANEVDLQRQLDHAAVTLTEVMNAVSSLPGGGSPPSADTFLAALPSIQSSLALDAEAFYRVDPAAKSVDEIMLCYPGFFAIAVYRIAHELVRLGAPLIPRMLTEYAHSLTGIDIHPGATVGKSFVIDHGTGVVIGETSIIGDNVTLYQGVTLGALIGDKSLAGAKRHPTLEDNVVVYANATILGGATVIGAGSVVGGNVWLTSSIPAGSKVYHMAEVRVKSVP